MTESSGEAAVEMSRYVQSLQRAEQAPAPTETSSVATIQGRILQQQAGGTWQDMAYRADETRLLQLVFTSDAYFTFLRLYPEAADFARLGQQVIFQFKGQFIEINPDSGRRQITEAELRKWFG